MASLPTPEEVVRKLREHGIVISDGVRVSGYGDSAELSRELIALIRCGAKRGGASLLWSHEAEGEPLPAVGDIEVVVDHLNQPAVVVRVTHVQVAPFNAVGADFAAVEGEGDGSLAHWRASHRNFFSRECRRLGREPSEVMPVVCTTFEALHVVPSTEASEGHARYLGLGPGPKTRDGCSVDLYLRLPYAGEVDLIAPYVPDDGCVVELGCGVGRVTRELLRRGYRVTAVDNSAEMLKHVPSDATKVCADIERLELGATFDAVLFASCLVNTPDAALRSAQLAKCRELLETGGRLVLQRFDPEWLANVQVGPLKGIGAVAMSVDEMRASGALREICLRYRADDGEWRQYFAAAILEDDDIARCLSQAGFDPPHWIDRRWAVTRVA